MSNLAHKLDDDDNGEGFFNAQRDRAERKSRFRLIQGGANDNGQADNDGGEDNYSDADDNGEASELSAAELREREASAKDKDNTPASDEESGFFTDKEQKRPKSRFAGTRNQRVAVGVFTTIIVSATAFILSFASGPAQFLHLTQMMEKFHFSSQQDDGESRMFKFVKYLRNRNKPQNNRMGFLGNKLADKWETRLRSSGIDIVYNSAGYPDRFIIDPEKLIANGEVEGLRSTNPEDVKTHFKENLDVDLKINGKTLSADINGLSIQKSRRLVRIAMRSAGYGRLGANIRTRIIAPRHGLTFNPIKRLEQRGKEKFAEWREKRRTKYQQGETDVSVNDPAATRDTDADGRPDAPSEDATATQQAADEVRGAADAQAEANSASRDGPFAGAGGIVKGLSTTAVVLGTTCLVQGLSEQFDSAVYQSVAQPLIRMAADNIATGSQIQSSTLLGTTLDTSQLGYASQSFTDDEGASWTSARSIQAESGQELTGPDIPDEARIDKDGNPVGQFLNNVPGLDSICGAFNSTGGQVAGFVIDVIAAGSFVGPLVGQATSRVIPLVTDKLIAAISPDPLDVAQAVGPERFGNFVNYGARLMANDSALAAGGRALTASETTQLKLEEMQLDKEEFAQKSLATRLFDTSDYRSLASRMMTEQSSKMPSGDMSNLATGLLNIGASLRSFASVFRPTSVSAATPGYDYGFPKIGFSVAERDDPRLDDPYANSSMAVTALQNSEYRDRVTKCFGVTISESDYSVTSGDKAPNYADISDPGNSCNDPSESWLRVRRYIADTQYMEAYACYEAADDQACQNVGLPGPTSTTPTDSSAPPVSSDAPEKIDPARLGYSSENITCAAGTKDLGVVTSKYSGNLKKESGPLRTRLCQVTDLPGSGNTITGARIGGGAVVDAYVSGAWAALARDAKAQGVKLSASSSFRLADSCGGTGTGDKCAKPGTSMHQTGWAIDFADMSKMGSSTSSCSGRARLPNNAGWAWLDANAPKYGLKQYTYEAWHWDPAPLNNRCGTGQ